MRGRLVFVIAAVVAVLVSAFPVSGKPKVRYREGWAEHPWARYAAMAGPQCVATLRQRGVRALAVEDAPGVLSPVRLPEGAGGVLYRTRAPAHVRARHPGEVMDCRLALALQDFSAILRAHGIREVEIASAFRPRRARSPLGLHEHLLRHEGGLAVDVLRFGVGTEEGNERPSGSASDDGRPSGSASGHGTSVHETSGRGTSHRGTSGGGGRAWLDVEHDFGGVIGAPVCGAGQNALTPAGKTLRAIVCEAASRHLFTSILTPNYDRAHKNHLHLEVTPGVQWELLR
ncbi:extensin family protein [Chondromyces crocatus]|uniref:Uncharacterized protein n=1 Tax=Chondromyces crocatus TaxID=52 RepID=A0A0K1E5P7_CHOCO|nr:extensin family protein [Chondromyces crocatus]AKT35898.1 uncharacterized protein CMC5_000090 [Chondromyces crocatus]